MDRSTAGDLHQTALRKESSEAVSAVFYCICFTDRINVDVSITDVFALIAFFISWIFKWFKILLYSSGDDLHHLRLPQHVASAVGLSIRVDWQHISLIGL